jgi:alanyl-tRNA synthetase
MGDQTVAAVKKIKNVICSLMESIDLLWMIELKNQKGGSIIVNVDEESKKVQLAANAMQNKLTELAGGIKLDGGVGGGGGGKKELDVVHIDKDKAEADALANFNTIPFNQNPFF